jgi:phage terminase small subunit
MRQEKFVEGVLTHSNKTRAARAACYSDLNAQAAGLSVNVGIFASVKCRYAKPPR